ncbi:GGDEF domain-containing protein [Paucibacter soli]|uniref:GGDEF domain-containing protein n=1 Tax=Paucibacter soli TaxID=3133433 RepID=UPI00309C1644
MTPTPVDASAGPAWWLALGLMMALAGVTLAWWRARRARAQCEARAHSARAERAELIEGIEALSEAYAMFDADDRLLIHNQAFARLYPRTAPQWRPGLRYEELLRSIIAAGEVVPALGQEEAWLAQRMQMHREPGEPWLQELPGNRWVRIYERKTASGGTIGIRADVTELVRTQQALQTSQAQLQAIISTAGAAIITIDTEGRMRSANPAALRLFGYELDELLGQDVAMLMDEPERSAHGHYLARYLRGQGGALMGRLREFNALHRDGTPLTVQLSVSEVGSEAERLFVGVISDLTERKRFETELQHANEQLLRLSTTDALTELANRRLLMQRLEDEWRRGLRTGAPLSLLLVDVDYFKLYNDHYGHQAGDAALVAVASVLRNSANRPADLVARYGGEEFVLLLAQTDAEGAQAVATRCRELLAGLALAHELSPLGTGRVTLSIGMVSGVPYRGSSASQWLAHADLALYQAKSQGRDRAVTAQVFVEG